MPDPTVPIRLHAIIHAARVDKEGEWTLTLSIPSNEGPEVAALALNTETVFLVDFTIDRQTMGEPEGPDRM